MILGNCEVQASTQYEDDHRSNRVATHTLTLSFPLPGGKAVYEIPILEGVFKSLETVNKLLQVKK